MLERKTCAINISDFSIEALELLREKGSLRIKSQSRIVLESGIIEDGKIIDQDKLRAAVKQLLAQAQPTPISAHEVVITLPESRVYVETLSIGAKLPAKQIPSALFSQAVQTMPLDAKQIAADFSMLRTLGDTKEYLFVATNAPLLQEYVTLFQGLSMKVSLVTLESLALAMATIDERVDETVLLLDIGARTTIASIFRTGALQESININIAGNNITSALAEKLKISQNEAEQRKMASGLRSANGSGDGAEMLIIQGQVQPLKDELLVFIKFYERKTGTAVNRVLLAGGTASLAGIDDYFSSNLGLPTTVAAPSPLFKIDTQEWYAPTFLNVLGLARIALGDRSDAINFLKHKENDWIPDIKKIPTSAAQEENGQARPMSRDKKRTIALAVVFFILLNLVGWFAWLKYATPAPPPPDLPPILDVNPGPVATTTPAITATEVLNNVSFNFSVGLSPEAVQKGGLPGKRQTYQIDKVISIDGATKDLIIKHLSDSSPTHADPTPDALNAAIADYLAAQLWNDNFPVYVSEQEKAGTYLLASFMDKTIATYEVRPNATPDAAVTMRINANYTGLIVTDRAKFMQIEKDALAAYTQLNPSDTLQTRAFAYTTDADGLIKVSALYAFSSKTN